MDLSSAKRRPEESGLTAQGFALNPPDVTEAPIISAPSAGKISAGDDSRPAILRVARPRRKRSRQSAIRRLISSP